MYAISSTILLINKENKLMDRPSSISFFKIVLSTYLALFLISFSLKEGHALEETQAADINFQSVHISSILPSSTCKHSSSKGPNGMPTLKIVDRYGPCHEGDSTKLTLFQILAQDQSRVTSIQARHASRSTKNQISDQKAAIPAKSGASLGSANYIVSVGLGTPKKDYTLVFDTGSDLTWTQCQPCLKSCYSQNDPIYDPSQSSTYSNLSCASPQCSQLFSATSIKPDCAGSTCIYGILYGDQSVSIGFFAKETLTLGTDVFPGFFFGCGQGNKGLFGKTAGLLGLGRHPLSVVSQTAQKYGKKFSYCLPTKSGSNGYLSFGGGYSNGVQFTPFSASQSNNNFYFVDMVGISVGGSLLPISASVFQNAGTVVDSGTVITRLPPAAYSALRSAFKQQMTQYKTAPAFSILDTCYDFSSQTVITVPKISIFFRGNAKVDLGITGILVGASISQICLGFAGNIGATDLGIFGNVQQKTQQVVYDVAGMKVGFGAGGCS